MIKGYTAAQLRLIQSAVKSKMIHYLWRCQKHESSDLPTTDFAVEYDKEKAQQYQELYQLIRKEKNEKDKM